MKQSEKRSFFGFMKNSLKLDFHSNRKMTDTQKILGAFCIEKTRYFRVFSMAHHHTWMMMCANREPRWLPVGKEKADILCPLFPGATPHCGRCT
jgi:hypothetical protein